jgi:hypothetical protein
MPRLPSEVLRLREAGWSGEEILDFDLGFEWFDGWLDGKRSEQVWREPEDHGKKSPHPKYTSLDEIFAEYDTGAVPGERFADSLLALEIDTDAILAALANDMELAF